MPITDQLTIAKRTGLFCTFLGHSSRLHELMDLEEESDDTLDKLSGRMENPICVQITL